MKRIAPFVLVLVAALFAGRSARAAAADAGAVSPADTNVVGSWVVTVTPDPASGVPPFKELYTFHGDGTLSEVDDNAPGPPFPFTPGHGVWRREGGAKRTFSGRYLNLIYDPATFASNGTADVRIRVRLSDDLQTMTGTGHAIFSDAQGNVMFEADGTIAGSRINLGP